ncbi:WavE lipopolysaccharide synthesis family protein [Pedobacter arcticus]|uniref:WavE lipopolysaccharide synthesis family protein n=1 Tax=Pedobacter arcticus TaxID=752140 RepID=UPI0003008118|nr:WavE lipopolysaccharide synthesis family protein [Pedobacter arcticus]
MISLIIQGPLNSRGFDAVENVKKLVHTFSKQPQLDKIIISTWSANENYFDNNEKVVYLENTAPNFKDFMNRYKQFISVYNAALYVKNNVGSKYLLKLRSDQFINPDILAYTIAYLDNSDYQNESSSVQENYIITSHSYNCLPYFIGDFYFGGTVNDILRFTGTYAKYQNFCHQWLPEVDITLKYLYEFKTETSLHLFNIRDRGDISTHELQTWVNNYTKIFSIFPQRFFDSLLWRGKPYCNDKHDYLEEWTKLKEVPEQYIWHSHKSKYTLRQRARDIYDYFKRRIYFKRFKQSIN